MDSVELEGTIVLEKLAEIGRVVEFYDAIDSDDFAKMKKLMIKAEIEKELIREAIKSAQTRSV